MNFIIVTTLVASSFVSFTSVMRNGFIHSATNPKTTRIVSTRKSESPNKSNNNNSRRDTREKVVSFGNNKRRVQEDGKSSPNNLHLQRREKQQQKSSLYYYLTLFIEFDDYARDIGWKLETADGELVERRSPRQYADYRAGQFVTEIVSLDHHQSGFQGNFAMKFYFTMVDSYGDGLVGGAYYQLNFTNRLVGETTVLERDSRFGRQSLVGFTLGTNYRLGNVVQVLDQSPLQTEAPTPSPTGVPTPSLGTSFLRLTLNVPGTVVTWQLNTVHPQTLKVLSRLYEGLYSKRENGIGRSTIPLEGDAVYEFVMMEYPFSVRLPEYGTDYKLTFVPATQRRPQDDIQETPLCLSQKDSRYVVYFEVSLNGTTVLVETKEPTIPPTAAPTVEPTLEPTWTPTVSPPPTDEPTMEPTWTPTVSPPPTVVPSWEPTMLPTDPPTFEPPTIPPKPIISIRQKEEEEEEEEEEEHDGDSSLSNQWFLTLVLMIGVLVFFLVSLILKTIRLAGNARVPATTTQQLQGQASQQQQPDQPNSLVGGFLPPEGRLCYVKEHLLTFPMVSTTQKDSEMPQQQQQQQQQQQCAICLADYSDGDVVSFSANPSCEHKFHCDCITAWLQNHNECPCCRQAYLEAPTEETADE